MSKDDLTEVMIFLTVLMAFQVIIQTVSFIRIEGSLNEIKSLIRETK